MEMLKNGRRRAGVVAGVGALVAGLAMSGMVPGAAHAATTSKDLTMTCNPPIGGPQQSNYRLTVTMPDAVKVGDTITPELSYLTVMGAATIQQAKTIGANGMDYAIAMTDTWSGAATGTSTATIGVKGFAYPAQGDATITGKTTYSSVVAKQAGTLTLTAGNPTVMVTPTTDGQATAVGTLNMPCTIDAGQDPMVLQVTVA